MRDVDVVVLHPQPPSGAGRLVRATAAARAVLADRHVRGFLAAGATRARVLTGPSDDTSFAARVRSVARGLADGGLVILGSGAIPLATARDRRELVVAAASDSDGALTNNRYSADVVAVARARSVVGDLPDSLWADNALPRWLDEVAGIPIQDRRRRWRLGVDIDGPLDLVLLGGRWRSFLAGIDLAGVDAALAGIRAVTEDPTAELFIAGRVSAANLGWLEAHTASRTRALVEERGLRTSRPDQRAAASVLGLLLDRIGPDDLGGHLRRLADAAILDSRVLLAHRSGADDRRWPAPDDRYASDLLLPETVADPWLRALTRSAAEAAIPVVLGGHTLVGPGLRLAVGDHRTPAVGGRR